METTATATVSELMSPGELKEELPLTAGVKETILNAKTTIKNILSGDDQRLLLIVGPCSIHDPDAALEYAYRLNLLREKYEERLFIIMRVYFEKPRTSLGWKGLINDPYLDGSCMVADGLYTARSLLLSITSIGLTAGMELLDPLVSHYVSDLASWVAIGARTSESQVHRELASSLDVPVGFKNSTDGSIDTAICSIISAANQHSFLDIDCNGKVCVTRTKGNQFGHLILRGSKNGPNYNENSIALCEEKLRMSNINPSIVVDCSHMNTGKNCYNQPNVWKEAIKIRKNGHRSIKGVMLESNIHEGNQSISGPLQYGVSITDECIGWDATEQLIDETYRYGF